DGHWLGGGRRSDRLPLYLGARMKPLRGARLRWRRLGRLDGRLGGRKRFGGSGFSGRLGLRGLALEPVVAREPQELLVPRRQGERLFQALLPLLDIPRLEKELREH